MKELQELRNEILHLRNMGGLTKHTESILLNKLNALEAAINHTRCCRGEAELLNVSKSDEFYKELERQKDDLGRSCCW